MLPMYSESNWEPWLYWPARVAVCARGSSLSTSPRDGAVGETYVPPPVIWQQWSSKSVTSGEPGYTTTWCCHAKSAPLPNLKLECRPPSVHAILPVAMFTL